MENRHARKRKRGKVATMNYAARFTQTGLRDGTQQDRVRYYYIRRTCIGEFKDNAKKKIRQRIARKGRMRRDGEWSERKKKINS